MRKEEVKEEEMNNKQSIIWSQSPRHGWVTLYVQSLLTYIFSDFRMRNDPDGDGWVEQDSIMMGYFNKTALGKSREEHKRVETTTRDEKTRRKEKRSI